MHHNLVRNLALTATFCAASAAAFAQAKVGDAAPQFTATDSNGKTVKLSDYNGKYVVLEWANKDCPFDRAHYESGNMQKLQREWTGKGVVWLTVESSAQGKQGYMSAAEANQYAQSHKLSSTAILLDANGAIGHTYAAKTTPDMFVIGKDGKLIYTDAIDDKPGTDNEKSGAKNYVNAALTEAMAGKPIADPVTRPYGCSVKYAD